MTKYRTGEIVTGCVSGIEKYGIFITLEEPYSGLIHISEVSSSFVRNIHDYVKIGETIKAKVIEEVDKDHKVKLSIKEMDYRFNKKNKTEIQETATGFSTLKIMLDNWIEQKTLEINKKKEKKIKKN